MKAYLIGEHFRIEGRTGALLEEEFLCDFRPFEDGIALEGCRKSYVSFQIVLDLELVKADGVKLSFEALQGAEHISQDEYETFYEWFHELGDRLIPDALVPFDWQRDKLKMPLDAEYPSDQKVVAIWVDLFLPEGTTPGEYHGALCLAADAWKKRFQVSVKVYDAVLPDESRIIADLNCYADAISAHFPHLADNDKRYDDGSYFELETEFHRMAHSHRCLFHPLCYKHSGTVVESYAPALEGAGSFIHVKSWERFDRHFGALLDGSAFKGTKRGPVPLPFLYMPFNLSWPANYMKWGKKGYKTELVRIAREFVRHFEEKGWLSTRFELFLNHKKRYRFFPYDGDEIRFREDEVVLDEFYGMCREAFSSTPVRFITRMDSSWNFGNHFKSRFNRLLDMWVVGKCINEWFPESAQYMANNGNIHFVYGSLSAIDQPLSAMFTWPMQCLATGMMGFTFWNTAGFGKDWLKTPLEGGTQAIFYPGAPFGLKAPVPSIRLKALRNAMQTADLAATLQGSALQDSVVDIINSHYGQSPDFWWNKKPEFINDPAHTWTNTGINDAVKMAQYTGKSPAIMERIQSSILKLASGRE